MSGGEAASVMIESWKENSRTSRGSRQGQDAEMSPSWITGIRRKAEQPSSFKSRELARLFAGCLCSYHLHCNGQTYLIYCRPWATTSDLKTI